MTLHSTRPHEKAIVFSQWPEMIDIVAQALQANRIPFFHVKTKGKDFERGGQVPQFISSTSRCT